jgi:hypothetical protein
MRNWTRDEVGDCEEKRNWEKALIEGQRHGDRIGEDGSRNPEDQETDADL